MGKTQTCSQPGVIDLRHNLIRWPNKWVRFRNLGRITLLLKRELAWHGLHLFGH